jgi:hypothetical protein
MSLLAQLLCLSSCLSAPSTPAPQVPQHDWDITYRHEVLSHGKHLLRLSTTDLLLDTDGMRNHRIIAFAKDYADRICNGRYSLIDGDRLTAYAGQVIFKCR